MLNQQYLIAMPMRAGIKKAPGGGGRLRCLRNEGRAYLLGCGVIRR
jgi:hypothetical protein